MRKLSKLCRECGSANPIPTQFCTVCATAFAARRGSAVVRPWLVSSGIVGAVLGMLALLSATIHR